MQEYSNIYHLKCLYRRTIDRNLLERIHYRYIINPGMLALDVRSGAHYDLRMLRSTNPKAWCYSMIRHILEFDRLSLIDRLYVGYWMMRITIHDLASIYLDSSHNGYYLYRKYVDRTFITMRRRQPRLVDYPAHRPEYLSDGSTSRGLGCYVQLCEKRLNNPITYTVKRDPSDESSERQTITEPFNDKFIRDIYMPLLRSTVNCIVICIDPLKLDSSSEAITAFSQALLSIERSTIPRPKTYIIVPDEHVNAPVGRNIMFSFIRTRLAETKYHWFGSDDDDRINTRGVDKLRDYICNRHIKLNRILMFDEQFIDFDIRDPERSYTRYAPWTYAFSPEYYNGLSYRCSPMEKEDLDFFNRLRQYITNFTNVGDILRFNPPVYAYYAPNHDRPKNADLFETGDAVDYMNVHNSIESIDADNEDRMIAPSSSSQPLVMSKRYFMNADRRYHYHEYGEANTVKTAKGPMRSTHYAMGIRDDSKTKDDIFKIPGNKRKSANAFLDDRTLNENLNGDLYVVAYAIYTSVENTERPNNGWGIAFQNGKSVSTEVVRVLPRDVTSLTGRINERRISTEMERIAPGLQYALESSDWELTDDLRARIDKWNRYYIQTYRVDAKQAIPLRTFGGRTNLSFRHYIILIGIALIVAICCCIVYRHTLEYPIGRSSVDPF